MKDLPGEEWKEIPGWEEYELSNYGRVKSIGRWIQLSWGKELYKKEKILSQTVKRLPSPFNKDTLHYLSFGVQREKSKKRLRTARFMYYLFVKRFPIENKKRIIRYKDGNGLNILPSNLRLTNNSEKMRDTISRKRTPRIKKVTQFDLSGKKIAVFETMHGAAKSIDGQASRIFTVLNKPPYYYKGFLWKAGDAKTVKPLPKPLINHPKKVIQFSLKGKQRFVFESLNQAAKKVGATNSNLRKALNGKCKTCRGYKWKWQTKDQ